MTGPTLGQTQTSHANVVLAVNLAPADRLALSALCRRKQWGIRLAGRLMQAARKAAAADVRVVICGHELPDGIWKELFERVRDFAHAPRFIVVSQTADERLWAEVLNLGAHDVLAAPFDAEELCRVMSYAMPEPAWKGRVYRAAIQSNGGFQ